MHTHIELCIHNSYPRWDTAVLTPGAEPSPLTLNHLPAQDFVDVHTHAIDD